MKYHILSTLLLCSSSFCFASCKAPESLFESKDCIRLELQQVDQNVRAAYRAARKSVSQNTDDENIKVTLGALAEAQKAWAIYRDKECNLEFVINGGFENASQNEIACRIELGRKRIARLSEIGR